MRGVAHCRQGVTAKRPRHGWIGLTCIAGHYELSNPGYSCIISRLRRMTANKIAKLG